VVHLFISASIGGSFGLFFGGVLGAYFGFSRQRVIHRDPIGRPHTVPVEET